MAQPANVSTFTNLLQTPVASVVFSTGMKIPKISSSLLAMVLLICALPGFASADSASAEAEARKPLDNRELHQLRRELGNGEEIKERIKGTDVKVRVKIHIRQDKTVWCTVINLDEDRGRGCRTHLTGFEPHFSSGLKNDEEYLLEGMIVEDRLCYGAFWVYASRLTKVE